MKKEGITNIAEVITLRQLRTEYKVYEAKRQLMAAYDAFLCDKKIAQCLPKLLGTAFIKKRKFPIQINMDTPHLKNQINKALSQTVFTVNCRGNSCTSEVARLGMDNEEIIENVLAAVKVLCAQLPGEQENIFGIYIKTSKSQAIPIFISFGNPNEVKIKRVRSWETASLEELSTFPNAKVKVFRDGRIVFKEIQDEGDSEADSDTEKVKTSTQSEESESEIIEEDSKKGKNKNRKRKRITEEKVESETSTQNEEAETVVEIIEEDSKTKKRRKKNTTERKVESEISTKNEELVEVIETNTNKNKAKKNKAKKQKRKSENNNNLTKANMETEASIPCEESVVQIVKENANKSKTRKGKKQSKKVPTEESKIEVIKVDVKSGENIGNRRNPKRKAEEALKNETSGPKAQKIKSVKKRQTKVKS